MTPYGVIFFVNVVSDNGGSANWGLSSTVFLHTKLNEFLIELDLFMDENAFEMPSVKHQTFCWDHNASCIVNGAINIATNQKPIMMFYDINTGARLFGCYCLTRFERIERLEAHNQNNYHRPGKSVNQREQTYTEIMSHWHAPWKELMS